MCMLPSDGGGKSPQRIIPMMMKRPSGLRIQQNSRRLFQKRPRGPAVDEKKLEQEEEAIHTTTVRIN